jgi:hypothetical protein
LRLVGDDNEWERFRDVGRRRVLQRYTWEATARCYLDVLEAIAKAAPRKSGLLSIPSYFTEPGPDTDFGIEVLGM